MRRNIRCDIFLCVYGSDLIRASTGHWLLQLSVTGSRSLQRRETEYNCRVGCCMQEEQTAGKNSTLHKCVPRFDLSFFFGSISLPSSCSINTRNLHHTAIRMVCTFFLSFSLPTGNTHAKKGGKKRKNRDVTQGNGTQETSSSLRNRAAAASPAATPRCSRRRRGPSRCPRPRRRVVGGGNGAAAAWAASRRHTQPASAARTGAPPRRRHVPEVGKASTTGPATASGRC